jgi:hypothetical protein
MPCPFPGMDPYLEAQPFWGDFTPGFIKALANALLVKLLPKYDVRVEEYLSIAHEEIRLHRVRPDVTVTTHATGSKTKSGGVAQLDLAKEELEYPDIEPRTQRHLKVIQPRTGLVVTVIEVLSPTNKQPGEDGLDAYLEKRSEFIASRSNLVKIDLLRGGERLPMSGKLPPGDYYVYIGCSWRKPRVQVIAWPWRRTLPSIAIPLLPEDGQTVVSLQEVFQAAYDPSFYEKRLPYQEPLVPPLSPEEEVWVKGRLAEAGLASP